MCFEAVKVILLTVNYQIAYVIDYLFHFHLLADHYGGNMNSGTIRLVQ